MKRLRAVFAMTFVVATGLACSPAERGESGEIEVAGAVDAFAMRVGDCYNDQTTFSDEVSDVPGVPCAEPHDNEVFATFDLPGDTWQGRDSVEAAADDGCLERFEEAVGAPYDESVLMFTTLFPTEGSWDEAGDREVICAAYHMELEKLTGSVLGSGM